MDYKLKRKVQDLRELAFSDFFKLKEGEEIQDELSAIDSIISIIMSLDLSFPEVSGKLYELDEMCYYDFEAITEKKKILLNIALELKNEIIDELYDHNDDFRETHKQIALDISEELNIDCVVRVHSQISTISSEAFILKDSLINYKDKKFNKLNPFIKLLQNFYNDFEDIYSVYINDEFEQDYSDNDDSELEYDPEAEEEVTELMETYWQNTSNFNYDISLMDDVYLTIFGQINEPQRLLIGIMISDFYEYHKQNEYMYCSDEDKDKKEILKYIEENSLEDAIEFFLKEPVWAQFIMDSYFYYNITFNPNEKLNNRINIRNMNKLNILKKFNKFINDTLIDETLDNTFITPISTLIRSSNFSLIFEINSIDDTSISDLLLKYFTSDFVPENMKNIIPKQLEGISIKALKYLQLKFIISDCFAREFSRNNKFANNALKYDGDKLYKYITSNNEALKMFLQNYIDEVYNDEDINLNNVQKQKIKEINKFTIFDI